MTFSFWGRVTEWLEFWGHLNFDGLCRLAYYLPTVLDFFVCFFNEKPQQTSLQ
jgi:hypothetical protein